ncbi:MAG TPA: hypothetical protein VGJ20_34480 [Xanthobacteraceae bacterium]
MKRVLFETYDQVWNVGLSAEREAEVQRESGNAAAANHLARVSREVFDHLGDQDPYGWWYVETDEQVADTLEQIKKSVGS